MGQFDQAFLPAPRNVEVRVVGNALKNFTGAPEPALNGLVSGHYQAPVSGVSEALVGRQCRSERFVATANLAPAACYQASLAVRFARPK